MSIITLSQETAAVGSQPPVSLFTTQAPAQVNISDGPSSTYELGAKFQSSIAGAITGIRFWKGSAETSGHVGNIWSAAGTLLATVTFANETASGWQVQNLATPLNIAANTTYVVSVGTSNTNYVCTTNGLTASISNPPLSTVVGANGVFGTRGAFPTQTYQASNYFRDVVFVPGSPPPPPPPPPPPSPPVVSNGSFSLTVPATSGQAVGTMTASGSPTSWAITAGNASGYFAIDNTGNITVTASGASGLVAGSYSLTCSAANAAGSGVGTAAVSASQFASQLMGWQLTTSNTGLAGAGVDRNSLPVYTGSDTPLSGTTISLKKITVPLYLKNGNITLDRCWVQPTVSNGLGGIIITYDINVGASAAAPTRITIKDCDIDGTIVTDPFIFADCAIRGVADVYRCHIFGMGSGIAIIGDSPGSVTTCVVQNNLVHNLRGGIYGGQQSHNESATIRTFDGTSCAWQNNWLESKTGSDSAAFFIQGTFGPVKNVTVTGNYMDALTYDLALEANSGGYSNMSCSGNLFGTAASFGSAYVTGGTGWATWTNNFLYNASNPPSFQGSIVTAP